MHSLLPYFIESGIGLALFYAAYRLFLAKETFFRMNRVYLLGAVFIALVVPLLNIPTVIQSGSPIVDEAIDYVGNTSILFTDSIIDANTKQELISAEKAKPMSFVQILLVIYFAGVFVLLGRFLFNLAKITLLIRRNGVTRQRGLKIVKVNGLRAPFSFFNYVFGDEEKLDRDTWREILAHERTHAEQLHTYDLIFMELLGVLLWFNPFIYLYKKAIEEVHEYLADNRSIKFGQDSIGYQEALLRQVYKGQQLALTSGSNGSLIKKRLKMMALKSSKKMAALKLLVILPIAAFLMLNFALAVSTQQTDEYADDDYNYEQTIEDEDEDEESITLYPPVDGEDIREMSMSNSVTENESYDEEFSFEMKIVAKEGTPVHAGANGEIAGLGEDESNGKYVTISFGKETLCTYAGLSAYAGEKDGNEPLKEGMKVRRGDVIGYIGISDDSKKPTLHYRLILTGDMVGDVRHMLNEIIPDPVSVPLPKVDPLERIMGRLPAADALEDIEAIVALPVTASIEAMLVPEIWPALVNMTEIELPAVPVNDAFPALEIPYVPFDEENPPGVAK